LTRSKLYREQEAYCASLLSRARDPDRKSLLEREREDWMTLADQERTWKRPPDGRSRLHSAAPMDDLGTAPVFGARARTDADPFA
jgi:hypothetical protein